MMDLLGEGKTLEVTVTSLKRILSCAGWLTCQFPTVCLACPCSSVVRELVLHDKQTVHLHTGSKLLIVARTSTVHVHVCDR